MCNLSTDFTIIGNGPHSHRHIKDLYEMCLLSLYVVIESLTNDGGVWNISSKNYAWQFFIRSQIPSLILDLFSFLRHV